MNRLPPPSARQRALARQYAADAAEEWGVTTDEVLGKSRKIDVVRARRAAMQRLFDEGMRQATIGVLFGRDRSSVCVALQGGKARGR